MIWLSWQTLRFRWPIFIGTFLALTLGVSLMATTLLSLAGTYTTVPEEDEWLLSLAITLLGNAAGVSGAAAILVVAGTFSFAVAQRRREFALLRAIGATPSQVRILVLGESIVIGIVAAIVGCILGTIIAPHFASWMASVELAPITFAPQITWWPLLIAAGVGFFSALLSAIHASHQASKVPPTEALLQSAVDIRTMTLTRLLFGIVCLGGAGGIVPLVLSSSSGIGSAYILLEILLLLFGVILLVPPLIPLLVWLVSWPFGNIVTHLARANLLTNIPRTTSMIAPIFITIGLAGAALSSVATLAEIQNSAVQDRIIAPLIITSQKKGIDNQLRSRIERNGATLEKVTKSSLLVVKDSEQSKDSLRVQYVTPTITRVMNISLISGNMNQLVGNSIALNEKVADEQNWKLGDNILVWLTDGTELNLQVVAIFKKADDLNKTVFLSEALQQKMEPGLVAKIAYVAPSLGQTPKQLKTELEPLVEQAGGTVHLTKDFLLEEEKKDAAVDQVALLTVIGLAIFYTALSIANTCIMATAGRFRDLALLQLSGATHRQIVSMIVIETGLLTVVAVVAAAFVTVAALTTIYIKSPDTQIIIPWITIFYIIVACFIIALVSNTSTLLWAHRVPAIKFAAARE